MIKVSMFGLKAVGICSKENKEKHTRYNVLLPKVSDNGARIKGPKPRHNTKLVVAATTKFGPVFKSSEICLMPGVNMELARGLVTALLSVQVINIKLIRATDEP